MTDGYCMKCKKKVTMTEETESKTKHGMTMHKGKCPICGTTVCCLSK